MSSKTEMTEAPENTAVRNAPARRGFSDGIYDLGIYFFTTLLSMLGFVKGLLIKLAVLLGGYMGKLGRLVLALVKRLGRFATEPFRCHAKALRLGMADIRRARREKGFFSACGAGLRMLGRIIFGKRGLAVTVCNYALPVISCVFLFNIVSYANSMTYALSLTVNGDFIGYISDETVFTDAEKIVQQRINYMDGSTETVSFEPSYGLDMVGYGSTLTKYQIADKLLVSIDAQVQYSYGMYIGSSFYGALVEKEGIERILDGLLDEYRTGSPKETVAFENTIAFEPGLYLTESVVTEDSIERLITSKKSVAAYYTAVEGDSPSGICSKLDMSYEEMQALNPGFSEDMMLYVGDKFLIHQEEPFLAVTVTREETYDVPIEYEKEYYNDDTRYTGTSVRTRDGEYGSQRVTANVSYINGVEVRRKVLSTTVTSEPVTELYALGTKPRPASAANVGQLEAGQMMWPVGGSDGGAISETMYGYGGYYGHSGVDIAAPYGTPVYAAESGTVVLAQWYYGYGNCVMIQHDSGLKTVYGHLSAIHVYSGQRVTQGDCVGDVGQTGQAWGNHLHFEVRINDVCVYPLTYVPWHKRQPGCVEW